MSQAPFFLASQTAARSIWGGESVGAILARNKGVGPGFDYLRVALALLIFIVHVGAIVEGVDAHSGTTLVMAPDASGASWIAAIARGWAAFRPLRNDLSSAFVPMFFALSGFLVTASALRLKNIRAFLTFRAIRIVPALSGEVLLSAFLLGPWLTSVPLSVYFTDPQFYRYFGNIAGFITYELPGLFENNPLPRIINGNLWTLPGEFYCYFTLSAAMLLGVAYNRAWLTGLFAIVTVGFLIASLGFGFGVSVDSGDIRTVQITYYFFVGCVFYQWRDWIPVNPGLVAIAALMACLGLTHREAIFATPIFLVYVTVYLGVVKWPRFPPLETGDYSYGIYLYGFPMCQGVVAALPDLRGHGMVLRGLALVLTIAFAVGSWHLLEKPCLRFKRVLTSKPEAAILPR